MNLETITNKYFTQVVISLSICTVIINAVILTFDISNVTKITSQIFIGQIRNITSSNAQSGDILSLQKNLELIAIPLSETLPMTILVTRTEDNRTFVSVSSSSKGLGLFRQPTSSILEANPFGTLSIEIIFDLSKLVLYTTFKSLVSCFLLILSLWLANRYLTKMSKISLTPIDQLLIWLEKLTIETLTTDNLSLPKGGISTELKNGFERLALKIKEINDKAVESESNRRIAEISKRVAHDIRSPVTALNSLISKNSTIESEQKELIEEVTKRINKIADDLLESKKNTSSLEIVAQRELINSFKVRKTLSNICKEKQFEYSNNPSISLIVQLDIEDSIQVSIPEADLQRIISNLINNSADSVTNRDGRIFLNSFRKGTILYIEIIDFGKGIPDDVLPILFKKPISYGKESSSNTGIGLYSSHQILSNYNGTISISSKMNTGTKVTITIPILEA